MRVVTLQGNQTQALHFAIMAISSNTTICHCNCWAAALFTGHHEVYDANVAQSATLTGNGSYLLNTDGRFINSGTFAPVINGRDNSITVKGDFLQTSAAACKSH